MILLAFHLSSAPHAEKQTLYYYYNNRNHQDHQNQPQHPNQNQPITQKKKKKNPELKPITYQSRERFGSVAS